MKDELRIGEWRNQRRETCPAADLTIVICSLNGEAGVCRCLDALSMQTIYDRLEVIVVDDGSTDGTSDVARAHGAIVIRHPVNRGLAAARNSGVRAASAQLWRSSTMIASRSRSGRSSWSLATAKVSSGSAG